MSLTMEETMELNVEGADEEQNDGDSLNFLALPQELRSEIINKISQRDITRLRLTCQQLKSDVDSFYDFKFNIYDTSSRRLEFIRKLRCKDCTVWKLTIQLQQLNGTPNDNEGATSSSSSSSPPSTDILLHPTALKVLRIYGPVSAVNLYNLISKSINLEHIIFSSRSNYPWMLNALDTPNIKNLKNLSSLRLILEYQNSSRVNFDNRSPPFMDFSFPNLKHFHMDINKCQPSKCNLFLTSVFKFIGRHSENLNSFTLCLRPFERQQCVGLGGDAEDGSSFNVHAQYPYFQLPQQDVNNLYKLRLKTLDFTETRFSTSPLLWKNILKNQDELSDFRFEWRYMNGYNFSWTFLEEPIIKSSKTLVSVNLVNISMSAKDLVIHNNRNNRADSIRNNNNNNHNNVEDEDDEDKIIPFDLSIFKDCEHLTNLLIRVKKNEQQQVPSTYPLLINGSSLPKSLLYLELFNLPIASDDLKSIIENCSYLRKLIINSCGSDSNLGLTPMEIKAISKQLLFLENFETENFNISTSKYLEEMNVILQNISSGNEGNESHIILGQGRKIPAHETLRCLRNISNDC